MKKTFNLTIALFVFILSNQAKSLLLELKDALETSSHKLEESFVDPPEDLPINQKGGKADLAGEYKFQVPLLLFEIKENTMTFKKCNTHTFNVKYLQNNGIKFTYQSGTQKACIDDDDQKIIRHFQKITSYQEGVPNEFQINGRKASSFFGSNRSGKDLDGKWNLQIPQATMKIIRRKMTFYGCNENNFRYNTEQKNRIEIKFLSATQKACIVDNDEILRSALENSKKYLKNQVSIQFFASKGHFLGTAYNGFL